MNVVIVESVAKAKAINKYLGSSYKVLASYGHVRDLPSKNGSVEPDKDFEMHWDVDGRSQKVMKEITAAVKTADKLILATDPDRERLLAALGPAPVDVDELGRATGLSTRAIQIALLELSLAGRVERHGHQMVSLKA